MDAVLYALSFIGALVSGAVGITMIYDSFDQWRGTGRFDMLPGVLLGMGCCMIGFSTLMVITILSEVMP